MEIMQKRASPALLLALDQLAAHYRIQRNERELEKTLTRLAEFFPENAITVREHASSGRARLEAGDYAGAAGLYGKVAAHLKGDDLLNYDLAKELSAPDSSVTAILVSADAHFAADSVPLAALLYEESLKRNPGLNDKHEAMTKLGWCFYIEKDFAKAEGLWKQVVKSASPSDEWRGRSRWHLIQLMAGYRDKPEQAVELCDAQAKEFAGAFRGEQALLTKAWLYWTKKDWGKASKAFSELTAAYPLTLHHEPIRNYIRDCEEGMGKAR